MSVIGWKSISSGEGRRGEHVGFEEGTTSSVEKQTLFLLRLVQLFVLCPTAAVLLLQWCFLPLLLLQRQNLPLSQVSGRKVSFLF